ncbi:MAG: RIP metalloprotease RseP [Lachnospiraceae bacterium]
MIRTIILFLIIFSVVVISHELGHFLIAKKNGIRVIEFSVGMGPTIFSFYKGGVKYALKPLPIGGACLFEGEDGLENQEEEETVQADRSEGIPFPKAGVWSRIATIFAGPFFNFLLAFLVALILNAFSGADLPTVGKVIENSAAMEAGLQEGDVITRINHERIHFYREVMLISSLNKGETMEVHYERDGQKGVTYITPKYSEEDQRYYIGIANGGEFLKCNPLQVFQYGFYEVEYWVKLTFKSLGMVLQGQVTKEDVSGPIGIAKLVGDSYDHAEENYGTASAILTMLEIVVLLSVNLGILNLLPFPALDGGRLVFMLIEVVRGKPIPPEKEGMVHFAGLVVLMLLMVFVMYNDIMKLVR